MKTSPGLGAAEAAERLRQDGPNVLPQVRPVPRWRRFAAEFTHFFALMLWAAAALSFIAGMPQLGVAVLVVIVVNGVFAYVQESRAERAAVQLRALLPSRVKVRRDGAVREVDVSELVRGDAVLLAAGSRIPADVVFQAADAVTVDESMLSGESEPVTKQAEDTGFGGTFLVNGTAACGVTATGAGTRLATIATLTSAAHPPSSPLNNELRRVVRMISVAALVLGGLFFAVSLVTGMSWRNAFLFAIGVSVAMVPEGLLPTVTLSLAMGAQQMARRRALVRHLQAVETLGSTTYICTDKTGTLTQNRMSAVEVWTPAGTVTVRGTGYEPDGEAAGTREARRRAEMLAAAARTASEGGIRLREGTWTAEGDPMDAALEVLARRLALGNAPPKGTEYRWTFDPVRKRVSAVAGTELSVKGAPEGILPLCTADTDRDSCARALDDMARRGLRVLAVARRTVQVPAGGRWPADPAAVERNLELIGLVGLHDPPRASVAEALRKARTAGIKVAMLTGDHPVTARAIAEETGLLGPDHMVLEGTQLPEDEQILGALLDRDGVVVSRVSPEQKLRVAKALQRRGHVLAMTGDGVNDGPALQEADIGVAMGAGGTDVAREAADLVLLDDDFATIIAAVEQGRATYVNIRRFLTYHLTDIVAELTPFVVWALSGGSFPLALGVLQILCLDIGTDLLPALALGSERPGRRVLLRPPDRRHLLDRSLMIRVFAVLGPVEAVGEMTAFTLTMWLAGWRPGDAPPSLTVLAVASGAAFTTVVLAQLANAFICRSESVPPWVLGWLSNRLLLWAVATELVALAGFLFIPPVADALGQAPPTAAGVLIALLTMPALLLADYVQKRLKYPEAVRDRSRAAPGP